MSSPKTKEEPKTYRLSIIPETEEDLEALKKDLIANEQLRFRLYIALFLQNVLDYESGKRKNLSTIIIKEE